MYDYAKVLKFMYYLLFCLFIFPYYERFIDAMDEISGRLH